ncbi:chitosanase [Hyphomicrobium nitrativorans]|nr:chitosanase [Hyphomicrobium nitrativorans]
MAPHSERTGLKPHLDTAMVQRIKSISNIFEVGAPRADFGYIEDLGDGRGYTITQYGFVTNELETGWIIERYTDLAAANSLTPFLAQLPPKASGTDSAKLAGFAKAWGRELARGPFLQQACDEVADRLYFNPAMEAARTLGVTLPVGRLILYDTILQHGGGEDPDSFGAILERARKTVAAHEEDGEVEFLNAFLKVRRRVLADPANSETADVWRQSVGRVDALSGLLAHNPGLEPPVLVMSDDFNAEVA